MFAVGRTPASAPDPLVRLQTNSRHGRRLRSWGTAPLKEKK
jgi:hypothetical protein